MFIGNTLTPRMPYQGAAFFSVSRRRLTDDGSFAGVIHASVLPEYFENFYARIGNDAGSFFALGLTDGTVLARFPALDHELRIDRNGPIGKKIALNPSRGLITVTSPADGVERRVGYQRLAEYPVYQRGAGDFGDPLTLAHYHEPASDFRRAGDHTAVSAAGDGAAANASSARRGGAPGGSRRS